MQENFQEKNDAKKHMEEHVLDSDEVEVTKDRNEIDITLEEETQYEEHEVDAEV